MGNLPLSKMDYESIKKLKQLNKNDLLDLIEGLSIYLKDRNFPIFEDVVDLLLNFNKELIPLINRIFEGEESDWKLNVLEYLLPQFPIGVLIELEVSLIKLVETPTTLDRELEVDMAAKEVLKKLRLKDGADPINMILGRRIKMEIKRLIPKDKMDIESVNKLKALDINLIKPIIPDLLEWTADANWPTSKEIGKLLLPLGRELIPHLRKILASDDDCWKYSILVKLVINLPKTVLSEMEADLKRLAFNPTEREKQELVDEEAADILSLLYQI